MKPRRAPSGPDLARALEDSQATAHAQAAAPTWADLEAAFPEARIVDHADGSRTCRIEDHDPGKPRLKLLNEMFRAKNAIECDLGQTRHARSPEVVMRDPSGHVRYVPEHMEERVAKKLGSRRARASRNYSTWRDREGRKWIQMPGESEWRLERG